MFFTVISPKYALSAGASPGQNMWGGQTWRARSVSLQGGSGGGADRTDSPISPPCKKSSDLYQFQERPLAKVGWTCPPRGDATVCRKANDHTDIFINQRIECYLNNTINLRPLTPHIMPWYTHKMAIVSWP